MPYTCELTVTYKPGCRGCRLDVLDVVSPALDDSGVTGLKLRPAATCVHSAPSQPSSGLPGALPGQQALPGVLGDPTNGFDAPPR